MGVAAETAPMPSFPSGLEALPKTGPSPTDSVLVVLADSMLIIIYIHVATNYL